MEAAFVDIGLESNGFLHVDEIVTARRRDRRRAAAAAAAGASTSCSSRGQEVVVQVVKDPLKTKGARLSMELSIAGRYLVYMPQGDGVGVSPPAPRRRARAPAQAARRSSTRARAA